jgi:anti-anti-sigma regulatory factor
MARIRMVSQTTATRVSIAGRLTASDMGRLERACAGALTSHPLRLHIDLRGVTAMDRTAAAVLARLIDRGAVIEPAPHATVVQKSSGP